MAEYDLEKLVRDNLLQETLAMPKGARRTT